ncbi:MAG: hypothetical protein ACPGSO_02015, partial [Vicingaceae bacterium]
MDNKFIKYFLFYAFITLCINTQVSGKKTDLNSFLKGLEGIEDSIIADSLLKKGKAYYFENNFSDSKIYLNKAIKLYSEKNNQLGLIKAKSVVGHGFLKQGVYDSALTKYIEVLKLSKKIDNKTEIARALNSLGRHSAY